jgi:hypothetical protein
MSREEVVRRKVGLDFFPGSEGDPVLGIAERRSTTGDNPAPLSLVPDALHSLGSTETSNPDAQPHPGRPSVAMTRWLLVGCGAKFDEWPAVEPRQAGEERRYHRSHDAY